MNNSLFFKQVTKGFTLIELLVVIAVLAILTTMAGGGLVNWVVQKETRQEAQQLQNQLRLLLDDAVISQTTLALKIHKHHIQIFQRGKDGWQEASSESRNHIQLGQHIKLSLLDKKQAVRSPSKSDDEDAIIYLGADGRVSPYQLRIEDQKTYCILAGDLAGNMQVKNCRKKSAD